MAWKEGFSVGLWSCLVSVLILQCPTQALFFVHAAMLTTVILCLAGGLGFLAVSKPALVAGQMDGWFRITAPSTQKPWWM
jgi:hypothetical protein